MTGYTRVGEDQSGQSVTVAPVSIEHDGKGDKKRSQRSAKKIERQENDQHIATEFKEAQSDREAFKAEDARIQRDGGTGSANNYNKISSPGKK